MRRRAGPTCQTWRVRPRNLRLAGRPQREQGCRGGGMHDRLGRILGPGARPTERALCFLTHKELPNDLRFSLHKDLVNLKKPAITRMMRNKKLADLVLLGM